MSSSRWPVGGQLQGHPQATGHLRRFMWVVPQDKGVSWSWEAGHGRVEEGSFVQCSALPLGKGTEQRTKKIPAPLAEV